MKTLDAPQSLKAPHSVLAFDRLRWILDPVGYLEATDHQHQALFITSGVGNNVVMTSDPDVMQYILTNDRKLFSSPSTFNRILEPLTGTNSVLGIEGDRHRRRRQLVMPSFHGDRLSGYGDLINTLTHQICDRLSPGEVFSARSVTQQVSLQVIFEVVFGLSEGSETEAIKHLLTQMADKFSSPLTSALLFFPALQRDWGDWSPWGAFLRLRQQVDELVYAELARRRAQPDRRRTDILSLLMAAHDEDGQSMSDNELRDEIMALLFAGHETTATAMAWGLYWLHQKPQVKAKLLHELDGLAPNLDPMTLARQPYLTAVCQETLRRSPVAMLTFPRMAEEPVEIKGYRFGAGTIFMGCMYLTLQRDDLYPNPQEFCPERFLERKYSPFEFIPFGNGARRCIGEALALYEMKLVLATVLKHYRLELADSRPEVARRRGVTLAPARGVQMKMLGKRESS